jgi:UDP-N-acetyl-D-mannosaminuronic acid transferase (WecB/TagA/CpsF family)
VYGATKKYAQEFTQNLARQYPWIDFVVVNARHTPDASSHAKSVIGRIGTSSHLFSKKNLLITQGSVFQQL